MLRECGGGQALEVPQRVEQAVGVIDTESVHPTSPAPREHQRVGLGEDLGVLHMERHEIVHVEEAAVVDLPRRAAPVDQPVHLRVEQTSQAALALLAGVERLRRRGEGRGGLGHSRGQLAQPCENPGSRVAAAGQRGGAAGVSAGQAAEGLDDFRQLGASRMLQVQRPMAAGQRITQDSRHRRWVERQVVLEVADARLPFPGLQRDLAPLQQVREPVRRESEAGRGFAARDRWRASRYRTTERTPEAGPWASTSSQAGFSLDAAM